MFSKTTLRTTSAAAAIAAIACTAIGSNPAMAASSGGAAVAHFSQCEEANYGIECYYFDGESNYVSTPSGNINIEENVTETYTFTRGTQVRTNSTTTSQHTLIKDGTPFEDHLYYTETRASGNFSCTVTVDYHTVDGQSQFDNFSKVCS